MDKFNLLKNLIIERHSWREYSPKPISDDDIKAVLEVARHTPTAFGSEPYHLLVFSNKDIIKALVPYIWNQTQVSKCSHLIIILSYKKEAFTLNSDFLKLRYQTRYNNDQQTFNRLQNNLINYLKDNISDTEEWAKRQSYIFLNNFIITAYSKNIVTSPMEGFSQKELINYLEVNNFINKDTFNVAVIVAAGYQPEGIELPRKAKFLTIEQLVKFIK